MILLIRPLERNVRKFFIEIRNFSFMKMHLKISSAKWRPFCPGGYELDHRPYSRQVTEWRECDVAIHPPSSVYPKAGNGALRDQWAIKYHCQNDSATIVFAVRDLVHWNYVTSENIPRMCKSWKPLLIHVFATYIFLFIRHSLHCNWLPVNCGVAASIGPPMK